MPGPMRKRGPSSTRFPSTNKRGRSTYGYAPRKRNRYTTPRRSVSMVVKRAVMGLADTKEINAISKYEPLSHNTIRATAITGDGKGLGGTDLTAVDGHDSRNLTYCLEGRTSANRDGNNIYAMDLDTSIHFSVPKVSEGSTKEPDNALVRIIFYEADHNTFKQQVNNIEQHLMTPQGLSSDECVVAGYLNRKDFRIVSDEVIDIRHSGSGSIERPTQYIYNKKIQIRKNLTYVDAYTPTKQMGVLVLGHAAGVAKDYQFGQYRVAWKFTFKDM